MDEQERGVGLVQTGGVALQERLGQRVTGALTACQVSLATKDTGAIEGSQESMGQWANQEIRVLMDQLDQEDNQVKLALEG